MRLPIDCHSLEIAENEALYLQTCHTCDNLQNYWNNAREGICKQKWPFELHIQTHNQFWNHSIYMLGQKVLIPCHFYKDIFPFIKTI